MTQRRRLAWCRDGRDGAHQSVLVDVEGLQGDPQDLGNFFLECDDCLRRLQLPLQPAVLGLGGSACHVARGARPTLGSVRTMYRVLAEAHEVRERRAQARHPVYTKPELVATGPNQVWSWDITKLKGPIPYLYYSLYVILDLFSRYVVGWMVARHENAHLAERLIAATCLKQGIAPQQLTIHADRGAPMRSKFVGAALLGPEHQRQSFAAAREQRQSVL